MSECDAIRGVRADRKKGFTNLKRNLMKKVTIIPGAESELSKENSWLYEPKNA